MRLQLPMIQLTINRQVPLDENPYDDGSCACLPCPCHRPSSSSSVSLGRPGLCNPDSTPFWLSKLQPGTPIFAVVGMGENRRGEG